MARIIIIIIIIIIFSIVTRIGFQKCINTRRVRSTTVCRRVDLNFPNIILSVRRQPF